MPTANGHSAAICPVNMQKRGAYPFGRLNRPSGAGRK